MNTTTEVNQVPKEVRCSDYGCANCLWAGAECKLGSMYRPIVDIDAKEKVSCDAYTYYD